MLTLKADKAAVTKADEDMAVYSKATAVYSKALAIYDSTNASSVYAAKDAKAAKDAAYATFIAAQAKDDRLKSKQQENES